SFSVRRKSDLNSDMACLSGGIVLGWEDFPADAGRLAPFARIITPKVILELVDDGCPYGDRPDERNEPRRYRCRAGAHGWRNRRGTRAVNGMLLRCRVPSPPSGGP